MSTESVPVKADPLRPASSIRLESESTDLATVSVVAVQPKGWRDAWRVLRGTYRPLVRRRSVVSSKGLSEQLKGIYTAEALRPVEESPLQQMLRERWDSNGS